MVLVTKGWVHALQQCVDACLWCPCMKRLQHPKPRIPLLVMHMQSLADAPCSPDSAPSSAPPYNAHSVSCAHKTACACHSMSTPPPPPQAKPAEGDAKEGDKKSEAADKKSEEKAKPAPKVAAPPPPPPPSLKLQACRLGKQLLEPHSYSLSSE